MSASEEILKSDQESEESRKVALLKRKQRKLRLSFALFGSLASLLLVTPTGLQAVGSFCKPHYQNNCCRIILQKTTDLLWVYGYYEETLPNYRYLYENTDENSNLELVQQSFYNLALTYYSMCHPGTAKLLFLVFKARWPIADKTLLEQIDRRLGSLNQLNAHSLGSRMPPNWVLELANKYRSSLTVSKSQFILESKKEKKSE
ncbi:MAG: hypothetical protein AABZ60_23130 [Planctomycetota bacterium]